MTTTTSSTPAAANVPAPAERAEATIKDVVRDNWAAIARTLPEAVDSKRFAGLVFNSVRRTPRLAEATAASMVGALLAAASLGLEVDTPLGEAYLLPYRRRNREGREWVEAQLIVGYQGLLRLCRQHPDFRSVSTGWVGANDHFEYAYGTAPRLEHTPASGDRGEPVAFWASYTLADGTGDFVVLSPGEVTDLRGKAKSEVKDPQHWMERKTALKQVLHTAPKSTQMAQAIRADERPVAEAVQIQGMEQAAATVAAIEHINPETGEIEGENA